MTPDLRETRRFVSSPALAFDTAAASLAQLDARLRRPSRRVFVAICVLAALGASLLCFAPRLQVLVREHPGSFEWTRGLDFARQCESPFDLAAHDPALRWRLLPAAVCHLAGLRGHSVFVLPWIGLALLLAQVTGVVADRGGDRTLAFLGVGLVATTSGVWTVTTWLGINDAWYLGALVAVAFARSPGVLAVAAFGGPWIDERFLIGLPLAVLLRLATPQTPTPTRRLDLALAAVGGALYLGVRLLVSAAGQDSTAQDFVSGALRACWTWLPWAPLGWFFGFRAAWCVVLVAIIVLFMTAPRNLAVLVVVAAASSLSLLTVLAADLTRATPILLPLLIAGIVMTPALLGVAGARVAMALVLAANLLMPALHVTYTKVSLLSPLPLEVIRLLRRTGTAL